ncbi:MAG: polysaccharide biosynthesis protein [Clostridiales bacterium]|nr:polysaccharide biosynthesis protein [Clostridiales bacterium]
MLYHTIHVEKEHTVKSFGRSAVALAAIGIIAKLIGALYRVPLTNIVGAEGMGLYQMVFPLYTVLLAFCGSGMSGATSRVVAKYTALGNTAAAKRTIRIAILPLVGVSVACTVGVALLRNVISGVQGNTDAGIAYLALCPSLLFAGGINVLRGYFQGRSKMLPGGISQLIEQIVKLTLGLYLSKQLLPYGVKYAVAGALIGVSVSELIALFYLVIRYLVAGRRIVRIVNVPALNTEIAQEFTAMPVVVSDKTILKELFSFALSVTLGALVLPITQMIDSVLVINLLMHAGAGRESATAMFGLFVGPVGTLINMPTVVVLSVAIAFLPTITRAVETKEDAGAPTKSAAKWIMLFVIPITAVFLFFPGSVCNVLYRKGLTAEQLSLAAQLLRVQAMSVFYIGILQLSTAVLQGYNKAHKPVINLLIGACVKVGLTPFTVRAFGITGAAFATTLCYAVAATLSMRCAYKRLRVGADIKNAFIVPTVFTALGALAFWGTTYALGATALPYLWQTIIGAAVFVVVYAAGILVSGAINIKSEISGFIKLGRKKKNNLQKE